MLFGRLNDDVTPAQASAELNAIDARLAALRLLRGARDSLKRDEIVEHGDDRCLDRQ
jgi:hypothetical protein